MKKNKRLFWAACGIFVLLIIAAAFYRYSAHPQSHQGTITPADRVPLQIPDEAIKRGHTLTLPILMYHHVGQVPANANKMNLDLTVSAENFEIQAKWLHDNNYTSISLQDLYLYSLGKFPMPKKPVIFTFDDGYLDVFTNAVPILAKYGFTGSFAIITQNPGTTQGSNVYASWQVIAQAKSLGQEIVSHTQNHFDGLNPKFSADYIFQNLSGSVADLRNNLGVATDILVYHYGHYTPVYLAQAKKAGFVMGVTVHEGDVINLEDLMQIPRLRVHGAENLQRFEDIILHKTILLPKPALPTSTPKSLISTGTPADLK